ncbi:hypothetical protein C4D60_Mb03t06290 [Musa balbisiana]|uniref:Uncharacterized protein n=1 Tax=Musa balbisiana TaxID=52838 RepID=A0A4S8JAD4_MUSBA|nr:hypothetical protein C4D60_Mb03t06290 [Musa balbisiana]
MAFVAYLSRTKCHFGELKKRRKKKKNTAVNPTGYIAKLERPHVLSASLTQSPNRKQSTR